MILSSPFAQTNEGQNIIELHERGFPLVQKQSDLTPLQLLFLIKAYNYRNSKVPEQDNQPSKPTQQYKKEDSVKDELRRRYRERIKK